MAQRATSLGPKPSLFVLVVFLFCFFFGFCFFGCLIQEKTLFFPRKGHFLFIFSVFLSFSLSHFGPPSFSVSLSLSLFFLLFFLSSFLSLFFAFFWFLVWVSFFIFLSSLVFFHERHNINILNCKFFFSEIISFFCFLPFFVSSSFFLSLLFPDFKLCFLFNIKVFGFKTKNLKKKKKKKHFLVKRGVATKRFFFINLCFANCQKLSFFFGPFFWQFLVDVQKTL